MSQQEMDSNFSDDLPLAGAFAAANDLRSAGLIEDWALGGALAAIYYVEPFTTYDADIFFIPHEKDLTAGIPKIYEHLSSQGWLVASDHLVFRGLPVQFLAASGLTEDAVKEAENLLYRGVPSRIFRSEHLVAIAASVGRTKDKARIEQMLKQAEINKTYLEQILNKYNLRLPTL